MKKRIWRRLLLVIIALIALYYLAEKGLQRYLTQTLTHSGIPGLTISDPDIELSLFKQQLTWHEPKIRYTRDTIQMDISGKQFSAALRSPLSLLNPKEVQLKGLDLTDPKITVKRLKEPLPESTPVKPLENQTIKIKNIDIRDLNLEYYQDTTLTFALYQGHIRQREFYLQLNPAGKPVFRQENISIAAKKIYGLNEDSYELHIHNVNLKDSLITLGPVRYQNLQTPQTYEYKHPYETDYISADIKTASLLVYPELLKRSTDTIRIKSINLDSASVSVYKSKYKPRKTSYTPLLNRILRQVPMPYSIDTTLFTSVTLNYHEKDKAAGSYGMIALKDTRVSVNKVCNFDPSLETISITSGLLAGEAPFTSTMHFRIADSTDSFRMEGNVKQLNSKHLNSFLYPTAGVQLSGNIENLNYEITGNDFTAEGLFTMHYSKMHVELQHKKKLKKAKLLSTVANLVMTNNQAEYKPVIVQVERDRSRSFFNLVMLCMQQGIAHSMVQL